jgi:hypothetical protein
VCGREQEIVDVGNVLSSYQAALAIGVRDPRRGDLDPQVAGMSGIVKRMQRLAGAMQPDANGSLAASCSDHAGPTKSARPARPMRKGDNVKQVMPKLAPAPAGPPPLDAVLPPGARLGGL